MFRTKFLNHTPYISFKVSRPVYPYTNSKLIFNEDIPLKKVALFLDNKIATSENKPIRSFQPDEVHPIGVVYDIHNEQSLERVEIKDCLVKAHRSNKPLRQGPVKSPLDYFRLHNGTLTLCDPVPISIPSPRNYIHILTALFQTPFRNLVGHYYNANSCNNYELFLSFIGNILKNDQNTWQLMSMNEEQGMQFIVDYISKLSPQKSNLTNVALPNKQPLPSKYPDHIESIIRKEQDKLSLLEPHHSEYHLTKQYLSVLKSIPFTTFKQSPIALNTISKALDSHYGLSKVKLQILNFMSLVKYTNMTSNVLLLTGPPGTGKTSIVASIAKSLNRPLFRIPLGGLNDPSELKGHRRTYIGSMPGKLINSLIRSKCMDPVILLDEIDKLSKHHTGDPSSVLLEVLDPEQHSEFMDHYIDAPIDISHCMFIATCNNLDSIAKPLLDRCTVVEIEGYTIEEKVEMVKSHLLPALNEKYRIEMTFEPGVVQDLVQYYCREAGVRQLKKSLEKMGQEYIRERELLLGDLDDVRPIETTQKKATTDNVISKFQPTPLPLPTRLPPLTITPHLLTQYLGAPKYLDSRYETAVPGVVMGLAWTPIGGTTLYIESIMDINRENNKSSFKITGHLKQVMQESASIAYTYAKHILNKDHSDNILFKSQIHVHVPEGGTPKDGPSAGITMCTSILSLGLNIAVPVHYAMTGELTLSGKVLRIGGLKEKVIAAKRQQITHVIFPRDNMADWMEIPESTRDGLVGIPVDWYSDVIKHVFPQFYYREQQGQGLDK